MVPIPEQQAAIRRMRKLRDQGLAFRAIADQMKAEAAAIRAVYEQSGEFSAAAELRRLFPAMTDTAQARACARTIAGWKPLALPPRSGKRAARTAYSPWPRLRT